MNPSAAMPPRIAANLKKTITMKPLFFATTLLLFLLSTFSLFAQSEKEWLQNMNEEEYRQVEVLVMYPAATRTLILEAARQPQALIKIKHIQEKTRTSFQQLLEPYSIEDQQAIWDLTRYPGLVQALASAKEGTLPSVLADFPKVIHKRASEIGSKYQNLLLQIADLQKYSETSLNQELQDYPENTANALSELIDLPEVISMLTEHLELTMMAGEAYQKDPEWVIRQADSLHLALAQQQAIELENWKSSTNTDSEALAELKASSERYVKENKYDDEYYQDYEEEFFTEEEPLVIHNYYSYNYPYWFGYPQWYRYPRWRPYPWWYDWGFYAPPGRSIIIFSIPSYYCVNWYFYHPVNHYYYPHLSSHFTGHYYGHRHTGSSIVHNVDRWKRDHKHFVREQSLQVKNNRVKWFKDFGKLEKDHQEYQKENKGKTLSKADYFSANKSRYPQLPTLPKSPDRESKTPKEIKNAKDQFGKAKVTNPKVPKTNTPKVPRTDRPVPDQPKVPKTNTPKIPRTDRPVPSKPKVPKTNTPKVPRTDRPVPSKPKVPKTNTPKVPKTVRPTPKKQNNTIIKKKNKATKTIPKTTETPEQYESLKQSEIDKNQYTK